MTLCDTRKKELFAKNNIPTTFKPEHRDLKYNHTFFFRITKSR